MAMSGTESSTADSSSYKNDERPLGAPPSNDAPIIDAEKSDIFDTVLHLLKVFPEQWESYDGGFEHKPTGLKVCYTLSALSLEGSGAGTIKFKWRQKQLIKNAINSILAASWHKAAIKSSLGKQTNYEATRSTTYPSAFGESLAAAISPLQNRISSQYALTNKLSRATFGTANDTIKFGAAGGLIAPTA